MQRLSWLGLILLYLSACQKDNLTPPDPLPGDLPPQVEREVPREILDSMKLLGMPIHTGNTPPIIEGSYTVSPFVLASSNVPGDFEGKRFTDYQVTFSNQDNDDYSITVDYINGGENGSNLGSFVTGEGCNFSVFVLFNPGYLNGDTAKYVHVLSGTLTDDGIGGFHYSNFMIDNYGNPRGQWIDKGQGRVIVDKGLFTPRIGAPTGEWTDMLPDCPCNYPDVVDGAEEMCGTWLVCGEASQVHHFGAAYEARWVPPVPGRPGQQCTYTQGGNLITGGIAAGSPDRASPGICGDGDQYSLDWPGLVPICAHVREDVIPWGDRRKAVPCGGALVRTVSCREYLERWPANNGNQCAETVVSGILHLEKMIGNMSCDQVSQLMISIADSPVASEAVKDYLAGRITEPPADLVEQLRNHRESVDCSGILENAELCGLLLTAIRNMD